MAIGLPTAATELLSEVWNRQIYALNSIHDKNLDWVSNLLSFDIERYTYPHRTGRNGNGSNTSTKKMQFRLYSLTSIWYVHYHSTSSLLWIEIFPATRSARQTCQHLRSNDAKQTTKWMSPISIASSRRVVLELVLTTVNVSHHNTPYSIDIPEQGWIAADSNYPPQILDDYDSRTMSFKHARLMQQPIYDTHGKYVPPWNAEEKFRKGTLVMIEARFNVHHFPPSRTSGAHSVRLQDFIIVPCFPDYPYQAYQIIASQVRTLAASPDPWDESLDHKGVLQDIADIVEASSSSGSSTEVHKTLAGPS